MTDEARRFPQVFWGLVAMAIGLVAAGATVAGAVADLRRARDVVAVTGSSRQPIRADYGVWRAEVSASAPALADAFRQLSSQVEVVRGFLREAGVPDSAVGVLALQTSAFQEQLPSGSWTGRILGHRASRVIEVRSADVDAIAALGGRAEALVARGIALQPYPPEYLYTKLAERRMELLGEATRDAQRRAEVIAASAGRRVGAIREARMGVIQVTRRNSTEVADYGMYDTSTIEKDVTAVVRVSFAIE